MSEEVRCGYSCHWIEMHARACVCEGHLNKILSAIKKHFCKNRLVHSCMKINIDIGGEISEHPTTII